MDGIHIPAVTFRQQLPCLDLKVIVYDLLILLLGVSARFIQNQLFISKNELSEIKQSSALVQALLVQSTRLVPHAPRTTPSEIPPEAYSTLHVIYGLVSNHSSLNDNNIMTFVFFHYADRPDHLSRPKRHRMSTRSTFIKHPSRMPCSRQNKPVFAS